MLNQNYRKTTEKPKLAVHTVMPHYISQKGVCRRLLCMKKQTYKIDVAKTG